MLEGEFLAEMRAAVKEGERLINRIERKQGIDENSHDEPDNASVTSRMLGEEHELITFHTSANSSCLFSQAL